MPRVVILGTGTGVGKTHVAGALGRSLAALRPKMAVGALKPIETGMASWPESDAGAAFFWNCSAPKVHPLYSFMEPVTPYLAALHAGVPPIELSAVVAWVENWEAEVRRQGQTCWTLIESAGGVFSPIARRSTRLGVTESSAITNVDLWQALEPCVAVLVARDGLGTLHDVTATLEALRARGLEPSYLAMNAAGPGDASTGTNATVLRTLGVAHALAVIGFGDSNLSGLAQTLLDTEY